jgi:EthD domain
MFKTLTFLKRAPGMSVEAFRDYYESQHARLGEKYLTNAKRYMRRYLTPLIDPMSGVAIGFDYDVVTEVWFASRAEFDAAMLELGKPDILSVIEADEHFLFDRGMSRLVSVDECESDMSGAER